MNRTLMVIPARNEADRIGRCLDSIDQAARAVAPVPVVVVVAADACSDSTATIARDRNAFVVETASRSVGGARSTAITHGLGLLAGDPSSVWISNTDADSVVAPDWLRVHLAAAESGVDLLLGFVRLNPLSTERALFERWLRLNPPAHDHDYVHGANLGFRADAYLASAGFLHLTTDEDVRLVDRFRADGRMIRSTDDAPVLTSARTVGRAPGGFAGYLRQLAVTPEREADGL